MVWSAVAGAVLKEGAKGGAGALAPVTSGGRLDIDFGGFGGVNFGSGNNNTLYVALAAVAGLAVLLAVMVRR